MFEAVKGGKNRQFKPDFYLPDEDVYHEVKGWDDRDSQIKRRYLKKYYPEIRLVLVPKSFFEDLERQRLCRLVPSWECSHFPARLVEVTKTYLPIEPTPARRRAARRRKGDPPDAPRS